VVPILYRSTEYLRAAFRYHLRAPARGCTEGGHDRYCSTRLDNPVCSICCLIFSSLLKEGVSIILPIRKFRLSEAQLEAPIPTLSDRQFVVDKSGMSARDARLQRELFWYREALFAAVRGRWSEAGGARSGELFLRRQRMALPMLETLRTETARVRLALEHLPGDEQADVAGIRAGRFTLQPNHFCALRLQVTNHSCGWMMTYSGRVLLLTKLSTDRPLTLSVDVVVEPAEHVIFEGSITGRPLGRVDSGASAELVVPVCFVSSGAFECVADVRTWEDTGRDEWVGSGRLQLHVRD
jgi:hypothetical protein